MKEEILKVGQRVEKGDEKAKKEYWRIVGKIKRGEISVTEEEIKELAKIRDKIFEKRIILSARKGSILFPFGFIASIVLFLWVNSLSLPSIQLFILIFLTELPVAYFGFLTGRLIGSLLSGIRFEGFYRYSPLEFGMKLNYTDYLSKSQSKRIMLYAATVCFEGVVLLVLSFTVYVLNPNAVFIPLSLLLLWFFGSLAIHYAAKTGELHRLLRELKIAKKG